jgi:hypothetical protein
MMTVVVVVVIVTPVFVAIPIVIDPGTVLVPIGPMIDRPATASDNAPR